MSNPYRLTVTTRLRPQRVAGTHRSLLLWADTVTTDIEAAALSFATAQDTSVSLARLFGLLGLAYAMVIVERGSDSVTMIAGHKNVQPIFFSCGSQGIAIRDELPSTSTEERLKHLDSDGFVDYVASVIVTGPYELSTQLVTFDKRWKMVPPGRRLELDRHGRVVRNDISDPVFNGVQDNIRSAAQAADELREAVDCHVARLALQGNVASEFSGGIDSSIVRARCLARIPVHYRGGVICRFPYAEFAREALMQDAVLRQRPGPITTIEHRDFLPFAALSVVPYHATPNLTTTAWGTFSRSAEAARQAGARVLLSGHGGDTLFRWKPGQAIRHELPADLARWLPPRMRQDVEERALRIEVDLNAASGGGFGGLWHPSMFDACSPTLMIRAGYPGMEYTSGLVSREVLRAAARLWLTDPPRDPDRQKSFAHIAFGTDLPDALWRRPGKVDHLGLVYRGAIAARQDILHIANHGNHTLDALGVHGKTFLEAAERVTRGVDSGNPMFSVMLSVLLWAQQSRARDDATTPSVIEFDVGMVETEVNEK